jgi:hypothetical protein
MKNKMLGATSLGCGRDNGKCKDGQQEVVFLNYYFELTFFEIMCLSETHKCHYL